MLDEAELVNKVLKNDLRAFESLVIQYQRLVYNIISKIIQNNEDIEDVSQEVFIKVHKSLGSFKFQSKLSTWIGRIAYHTALNHLKKFKPQENISYSEQMEDFQFTQINPGTITEKKDVSSFINELINQMPLQYKTLLTLFHLNEFTYQEIEKITGLPEGTVKGYLFRARKLLKEKVQDYLKNEIE